MKRRALLATALAAPAMAQAQPRVVVVGGGFGGASAARALLREGCAVTLLEPEREYISCPFSNAVLVGLREMPAQRFGYAGVTRAGVRVIHQAATAIDAEARRVTLADGSVLPWDRLVLAPGIEIRLDNTLPGYDAAAAEAMPHAWKAGPQTLLLRRQLQAMADGGTVVMSIPANPYRCPPGPYERASLLAWWLKQHKPRSKLLLLDAKDAFSKQRLFEAAWAALFPNLERVALSAGGKVTGVEPGTLVTEFGRQQAAVANVIPPQRAGVIAQQAGVTDRSGWCPIDPTSFESRLRPGIHIIGDAAIAGAMPKSAFAANAQAKACASAIGALLRGAAPGEPRLMNTCYSLVQPEYGISIAGVYRPANGLLADVEGAGGTSPLTASPAFRAAEAHYAEDWFQTITVEAFG